MVLKISQILLPGVALFLLIAGFEAAAEKVGIESVLNPIYVSIDRRPDKDLSFSKCIANFQTRGSQDSILTGVNPLGDRVCPGAAELTFDYTKKADFEKVSGDGGKTVGQTIKIDGKTFLQKVMKKGQLWQFTVLPFRISVKVPSHSDPRKEISDSFCVAEALHEGTKGDDEYQVLACDDCSSIQKCFETELPGKKPLSIGKQEANSVHSKSNVADTSISADAANQPVHP